MSYSFHWRPVWEAMPALLGGAAVTAELTVFSVVAGTAVAVLLALASGSRYRVLRWIKTAWVELARNTPALFQVYMAYFGLGAFRVELSPYASVLGAITFNNAGYLAETFRGGLNAVSPTQRIAALSLGMRPWQAYFYVILPQLFRVIFYPWTNQLMWALLNTSLGMFVGLEELSGTASVQASLSFRTVEFFSAAAVIYYLVAKLVMLFSHIVARRFLRE